LRQDTTIGVDVGTTGVRAVAADRSGRVLARSRSSLPTSTSPRPGWVEQSPLDWWGAACRCLRSLSAALRPERVAAVCVDGTSGTILAVDADGRPLGNAILYNDSRSAAEAEELNRVGADLTARLGYRFHSSYGLPKVLWLVRHEQSRSLKARFFLNAADFVLGMLCDAWGHTDHTNALKMGYDLLEERWPPWLERLGIASSRMPQVHPSGEPVGAVTRAAAEATGLARGTAVAVGPTDGVAAFYASGACRPGEASTVLGTTLVVKSVSTRLLLDPLGRVYCHRHASGRWLPGGASNCGCAYAEKFFPGCDPGALAAKAQRFLPCEVLLYPLAGRGERFPTVAPEAERFLTREPRNEAEHFAAYLQAVAFVERWAYETVEELGGEWTGPAFTSGGGSASDVWMQLRADVLGKETRRASAPHSAFGSAVLAASRTLFEGVDEAVARMVRMERRFEPAADRTRLYRELYGRFRRECGRRGLDGGVAAR